MAQNVRDAKFAFLLQREPWGGESKFDKNAAWENLPHQDFPSHWEILTHQNFRVGPRRGKIANVGVAPKHLTLTPWRRRDKIDKVGK